MVGNAVADATSVERLTSRHCAHSAARVFSASAAKRTAVATDQEVRRKMVTGRQTKHNLSYLGADDICRFVSRAVATSQSPDSSTASAMFRPKPLALPGD